MNVEIALIINVVILLLVIIIAGTGILVLRDAMRDETIIVCEKQGVHYTIQDWDNGMVNYRKCNITQVNGLA
jgi:hypothetical protein